MQRPYFLIVSGLSNRRKFGCTCIWICKPARYDGLFLKFGDCLTFFLDEPMTRFLGHRLKTCVTWPLHFSPPRLARKSTPRTLKRSWGNARLLFSVYSAESGAEFDTPCSRTKRNCNTATNLLHVEHSSYLHLDRFMLIRIRISILVPVRIGRFFT